MIEDSLRARFDGNMDQKNQSIHSFTHPTGDLDCLLICCPPWDITKPPINIAYLSTFLKSKGINVDAWDLNIKFYNAVRETKLGDLWNMMSQNTVLPEEMTDRFFAGAPKLVEDFVDHILNSGARHIGFSVHYRNILFTERMVKMIREQNPNRKIIYGGPEVAVAFRTNQLDAMHADAFVIGEGEQTLLEAIRTYNKNGRYEPIPGLIVAKTRKTDTFEPRDPIKKLDDIPFPTYEEFDLGEYHPDEGVVNLPFLFSRGCIGRCSFCMDHFISGRNRNRTPASAVEEIKNHMKQYGVIYFSFNDLICNGSPKSLGEFCDLLIKENLGIYWWSYAVIRRGLTYELFHKMKRSGCLSINFGLESASDNVLKLMNKYYDSDIAEQTIRNCSRAGIQTSINIIVGFPGESRRDHQDTLDFLKRNKDYLQSVVNLGTLMLTPGSDLSLNPDKYGVKFDPKRHTWFTDDGLDIEERNLRASEIQSQLQTLGIPLVIINKEPGKDEACCELEEKVVTLPKRDPKVRLTDVKFFNALDQECADYQTNEMMTMAIHYEVDQTVVDPLIRVQIYNDENPNGDTIFFFGMNTERFNIKIGPVGQGRGEARLLLYRLNLLPGTYKVTAGIWADETADVPYDEKDKEYEFTIMGRADPLAAKAHVPVNWAVHGQTSPPVGGHNALEYIAFLDHEGVSKPCFITSEILHLHIGLHLAAPDKYSLSVTLLLQGYPVHRAVFDQKLGDGRRIVELVYTPINLLENTYEAAVSLIDKANGRAISLQRSSFDVRSRRVEGAGLVTIPTAWDLIKVPHAQAPQENQKERRSTWLDRTLRKST